MAETTRTPRIELMTSIMYEWVGTSDLDASSRGNFIDARKVIVLESFLGEPFIQGGSQNPRQQAARLLEQAFSELTQSMYKELMAQTHFKPYLDSIEMVFSEDGITLDFTATDALFAEYRAENKLIALDELIEFNQLMGKNLVPLGWTGTNLLLGWLQEDFGMGSLPEGFESDFVIYGSGTLHGTDGDSILIGDESNNRIYGQGGNNTLIAGDGNNHLYGGSGDNLFIMGGGTDRLYSQNTSSNDIYRFGRGNGSNTIYEYGGSDVIELGQNIAEEHVTVRRNGANLVLTLDTGESVTVNGMFQSSTGTLNENRAVELIRFADGTEWDIDRIRTEALKPAVGGETIYGFDTDDTLQGGDGNDRLYGGGGNNTLIAGSGNNYLYGGAGNDTLIGGEGNDRIYGQGGNNTLIAGDGNNHLYGGSGDNLFIMGGGTDRLYSQNTSSNDIYRFGRGNGSNTIYEYGGSDVIELGQDIAEEHVTVRRNGANLVLTLDTGESITVNGMFQSSTGTLNENRAVELIRFADGTEWDIDRIRTEALKPAVGGETIYGFDTDDTLQGGDGNDRLYGGGGNNTLIAGSGNNYLYGGAGNDTLIGGEGSDRLYGGAGDDVLIAGIGDRLYGEDGNDILIAARDSHLYGGRGADQYHFQGDYHNSRIHSVSGAPNMEDTAHFNDASAQDLWFRRSGNDLLIDVIGTENQVRFIGWYRNADHRVGEIHAGDMVASANQIDQLVLAMAEFAPEGGGIHTELTDDMRNALAPTLAASWSAAA
ncbi:calcium-binding protein [Ectothiorhodospira shaposhnikovii]|uniref:calcium-binding protein n=1 Tax=Ectothiorhodospira shaposhnikovii TaxID=1054 RepID=UPI0019079319|nr:calcium-binding protein [Ectothiorhodospira shaposhnikovii]